MVLAISTRQSQHGFQHLGGHEHGFLTTGWPPSRCRGLASHAATCHTAYHGELAGEHSAAQRRHGREKWFLGLTVENGRWIDGALVHGNAV